MDAQKSRQFSGQLYKYTNVMRGWQHRYFTVDSNAGLLQYYLCDGEKPDTSVPRGSVHLAGAVICPSDEDSKTFTVHCASGDMLKLRATDARERQEWVNRLRAVSESHTKVNIIFYESNMTYKFIFSMEYCIFVCNSILLAQYDISPLGGQC